jgi:hypothetical protein
MNHGSSKIFGKITDLLRIEKKRDRNCFTTAIAQHSLPTVKKLYLRPYDELEENLGIPTPLAAIPIFARRGDIH